MRNDIYLVEEALLNSMPSFQTFLINGWVIRLNKNYTYRANCACPLLYTKSADIQNQIEICEKLFIANKIPPVFKVTSVLQCELPNILLSRNYQNIKSVKVMRCKLEHFESDNSIEIRCLERPDNRWLMASANLSGLVQPDLIEIHCQNLNSIAVKAVFAEALSDGKTVGCGYGTIERGYIGIYDLHVNSDYRCKGIGTAICRSILRYGIQNNAKYAYLIVNSKNKNAISLYMHMGFNTMYEYNFYCKSCSPYSIVDA